VPGPHQVYGVLTTSPNAVVEPIHPKAMPVINAAERGVRGIALGRKSWLFCGSDLLRAGTRRGGNNHPMWLISDMNPLAETCAGSSTRENYSYSSVGPGSVRRRRWVSWQAFFTKRASFVTCMMMMSTIATGPL
jgi:hypothetical protein